MKKSVSKAIAVFLVSIMLIAFIPEVLTAADLTLDETTPRYLPYINEIVSGAGNTMYALLYGEGIWEYDGSCFKEISDNLPDLTRSIVCSKDGVLYAGGLRGIWRYNDTDWVLESELYSHRAEDVSKFVQSKDGTIYAHTGFNIWKFNGEEWEIIDSPRGGSSSINYLAAGTDGVLFIEMFYNEIWMYDGAVWTDISDGLLPEDTSTDTNFILAASDGSIYAATQGRGVWRYDGKGWSDISFGLTEDSIYTYTLFESKEGTIYVGTYEGVWQYNGRQWSKVGVGLTGESEVIISLRESSNGKLFAGSRDGVAVYDGNKWDRVGGELRGNTRGIYSLELGSSGVLYCAENDGVWKNDGNGWYYIGGYEWENPPDTLMEASDGTLYAGFWFDGGVWKYDGKTWSDISNGLTRGDYFNVTAISEDSDGTLYASTNHGVWSYNGSKWTQFYKVFSEDIYNVVNDMIVASDDAIYIACTTNGVQKFDGTVWTNMNENLPEDLCVNVIIEASDGAFYIGAAGPTVWRYGETGWINISNGIGGDWYFRGIESLLEANDGTLYLSEGTTIWLYDGSKWYEIYTRIFDYFTAISVSAEGILYAGSSGGILTWSEDKVVAANNPFADISEGDWLYNGVEYVFHNSLFSGTSATTFAPEAELTRAMAVTVLWRNEGCPKPTIENAFSDLKKDWYRDAVNWATQEGIVNGYGDGTFRPDDAVTREQLVTILYRYIGSPEADTQLYSRLDDADDISDWAAAAVKWTYNYGFLKRRSTINVINPQQPTTRLEAAGILMRMQYFMS